MIQARALRKTYGDAVAVDDLSFDVSPGRVTGFLGPNGAGKSTTLRMVLGLDRPTSGEVRVLGAAYDGHHFPLREVGALLDAKAVHPSRSARHHLEWVAASNDLPRGRVEEMLALTGLTEVADRRAGGFSLGMSQRLGIAGALIGDPAVVLFDEPINGLDPEGIRWIRTLCRRLAAEGRTVFVSSHVMSEMALTADHILVIGRGRLVADCPTNELLGGGQTQLRLTTPDEAAFAAALEAAGATVSRADGALLVTGLSAVAVGDLAHDNRWRVHGLAAEQASLEEAFLALTRDEVEFSAGSVDLAGMEVPA